MFAGESLVLAHEGAVKGLCRGCRAAGGRRHVGEALWEGEDVDIFADGVGGEGGALGEVGSLVVGRAQLAQAQAAHGEMRRGRGGSGAWDVFCI